MRSKKSPEKVTSKRPKRGLHKLSFSLTKHTVLALSCLFVFGGGAVMAIPVSYEGTEKKTMHYDTEYRDENGIELGTENVAQPGKNGEQYVKYRYKQPLFFYLFRKDEAQKIELDTGIISQTTSEIVLKGTRKWQYMMCSDGTSRYYTDEQFKDKNTGFTSKSPDYCAQNNQGTKVSLADSRSGNSSVTRPSYVPKNCRIVDIPYQTVYQDASWLYVGETQNGYGVNGFKYVCSDGSVTSSVSPVNKTVYRGTRSRTQTPSYTTTPSATTPNTSAKYKCDTDYNNARVQLSLRNATDSSAMDMIQRLYAQCLRNAGY